jgi:hypothetical protein
MKAYGTPDADPTVYDALVLYLEASQDGPGPDYFIHHPRVPIDARPCRLPLSLRVQAVMPGGAVVTAFQARPGARVKITHS